MSVTYLTATKHVYIHSIDGVDEPGRGSETQPMRTLQYAVDHHKDFFDLCGFGLQFHLQNAGPHAGCEIYGPFRGQRKNEDVQIIGRDAVADMSVVTVNSPIWAFDGARLRCTGFRIINGYTHFLTRRGGYLELSQIDFGPNGGGSHAAAGVNSELNILPQKYFRCSGGGGAFFSCAGTGAHLHALPGAVILCDTPVTFGIAVLTAVELALLNIWDVAFVNPQYYTGMKYSAGGFFGTVYTGGKDPSFIPGSPGSGNYG